MADDKEFFRLRNGKVIADEDFSEKMYTIKSFHPESPQESDSGFSWDESGMAELFAECYKSDTRYCPERKSWYTYADGRWQRDTEALLVSNKVREFARLMTLYCGEITDDEKRGKYAKFILKLGGRKMRENIIKDARDNLAIPLREFDRNPYLINCRNGTYDLQTHSFREHDWRDFITMQSNVTFTRKRARCNRWERFIDEVTSGDEEKADYLQRALGYSIIGTNREECMFILHGKTTRNGKSTLLNTVNFLLGDYATVSPVSIICKSDKTRNAESASPTLASLKGKRFVTMAESNQYGKLDEESIKQLTGGEEITARNLYENASTFLPQFTMWLSCNDLPAVQDKSLFASDRIRVIEFNRHFGADERDTRLKEEFQTAEAMRGIFAWLVDGCKKYFERGLGMPPSMQAVIDRYESDNDAVLQFLSDEYEIYAGAQTALRDVYEVYKLWCKRNGCFQLSVRKFRAGMEAHPEICVAVEDAQIPTFVGISKRRN